MSWEKESLHLPILRERGEYREIRRERMELRQMRREGSRRMWRHWREGKQILCIKSAKRGYCRVVVKDREDRILEIGGLEKIR